MKKILFSLLALGLSVSASAAYSTMMFQTSGGVRHYIDLSGLSISFADDNLTAANASESISIPLADMASMEFSETTSGIDSLSADRNTLAVSVFLPSGTPCGDFSSLEEAKQKLDKGVYVIRYSDGFTLKLAKK